MFGKKKLKERIESLEDRIFILENKPHANGTKVFYSGRICVVVGSKLDFVSRYWPFSSDEKHRYISYQLLLYNRVFVTGHLFPVTKYNPKTHKEKKQ